MIAFRLQIRQRLLYYNHACCYTLEILIRLLTFLIQRLQTLFFIFVTFLTFF